MDVLSSSTYCCGSIKEDEEQIILIDQLVGKKDWNEKAWKKIIANNV